MLKKNSKPVPKVRARRKIDLMGSFTWITHFSPKTIARELLAKPSVGGRSAAWSPPKDHQDRRPKASANKKYVFD